MQGILSNEAMLQRIVGDDGINVERYAVGEALRHLAEIKRVESEKK